MVLACKMAYGVVFEEGWPSMAGIKEKTRGHRECVESTVQTQNEREMLSVQQ